MSSIPNSGDIARLRARHYAVECTDTGPPGTIVDLACIVAIPKTAIPAPSGNSNLMDKSTPARHGNRSGLRALTHASPSPPSSTPSAGTASPLPIRADDQSTLTVEDAPEPTRGKTAGDPNQLGFFTVFEERRQVEDNMRYWRKWLTEVETDLKIEPARIAEFYDVKTTRIEPVGIVYLWPA